MLHWSNAEGRKEGITKLLLPLTLWLTQMRKAEMLEEIFKANIYIRCSQLYRYCMFATLLEFCHSHINTSTSTHSTDKKIGKWHAWQILNILMPVCLLVCKCSFCFSPEFLFQQDTIRLHECKQILLAAVFGCSTMQLVLWPNAPLIGGWAVLFTPWKYIFHLDLEGVGN